MRRGVTLKNNSRRNDRNYKKRKRKVSHINSVIIVTFAVALVVFFGGKIDNLQKEKVSLNEKEARVQSTLKDEEDRTEELNDQSVSVQTKEYIESEARKLGYVYPDEIILKPKTDK